MWIIAILQIMLLGIVLFRFIDLCRITFRFSVFNPVSGLCIIGRWIHKPLLSSMVLVLNEVGPT